MPQRFRKTARSRHDSNGSSPRALLCIGGAGRSQNFQAVVASEYTAFVFAQRVVEFVEKHELDGVDIDWEANFTPDSYLLLLRTLRNALSSSPLSLRLTAALHHFKLLPASAYQFVDAVHLMAYDLDSGPGGHSSFSHSQQTVGMLEQAGCPKHKIVLGVPAYSRRVGNPGQVKTYSQLVQVNPRNAKRDKSDDGDAYNGVGTIRAKTRYVCMSIGPLAHRKV